MADALWKCTTCGAEGALEIYEAEGRGFGHRDCWGEVVLMVTETEDEAIARVVRGTHPGNIVRTGLHLDKTRESTERFLAALPASWPAFRRVVILLLASDGYPVPDSVFSTLVSNWSRLRFTRAALDQLAEKMNQWKQGLATPFEVRNFVMIELLGIDETAGIPTVRIGNSCGGPPPEIPSCPTIDDLRKRAAERGFDTPEQRTALREYVQLEEDAERWRALCDRIGAMTHREASDFLAHAFGLRLAPDEVKPHRKGE